MSNQSPSLAKLQEIVNRRRYQSETTPGPDIVVDKEGRIIVVEVGPDGRPFTSRPVSKVPKDTFAADYYRVSNERSFVNSKMPSNTYRVDEDGIEGWMYEINTGEPYYEDYTMFIYYDSGYYYVKLVDPPYAGKYSVTSCHLFSNGTLCLSSNTHGGYASMEQAYSKSVLWAKGFSEFRRTGTFPFLT